MNAFTRRGACPALSAPMQTGDGLLVRLNPLSGGFRPELLIGLCKAALQHGNGVIEVTARGSLQVRGLTPQSAPLLARDVDALGIAVRTGLPVEHGSLAGLDPEEVADPRPLASRIRDAARDAGLEERLGPKVSVVLDGGGRSGLAAMTADVRLQAFRDAGRLLWALAVGGDARSASPLAMLPDEAASGAAIAALEAVAALGPAARGRDLDEGRLQRLAVSVRSHIEDTSPEIPSTIPVPADGRLLVPSLLPLRDGRSALTVALPFGQMDAGELIAFTASAEEFGATEIRLAPMRIMLALCPAEAAAKSLRDEAGRLGFVIDTADPRAGMAACPGAPACASGRIPARQLAARMAGENGDVLDGSLEVHVSGCAKGCAHPALAALTLVGAEGGVGLVLAGTARSTPLGQTAAETALQSFGRLASLIRAERRPGETSSVCAARLGSRRLAEAFKTG